jgi:hypothetical protein
MIIRMKEASSSSICFHVDESANLIVDECKNFDVERIGELFPDWIFEAILKKPEVTHAFDGVQK